MKVVLAASALLAYLRQEPGGDVVDGVLGDSVMASVNWAEVVQKSISAGVDVQGMLEDGYRAGRLGVPTRQLGLSLGDRAFLSLGLRLRLKVLTCDRAWAQLPLDVVIQLLR